jgi:hypothetical protein
MSTQTYGLVAEFAAADALLKATQHARANGYTKLEAYSPFPVKGLAEAVGASFNGIAPAVFLGGALFAGGMYLLEVIWSVWGYPFNIGGRPFFSWPAFVLPALEVTFLGASTCGFIALLILNRLPKYYHSIFNTPNFERASRDRFFVCITADDPQFEPDKTRRFLETLTPLKVSEVAR